MNCRDCKPVKKFIYSKTISALIFLFIFFFGGGGVGGGGGERLFEAGRLLTFPIYRVGAYSRLGA